MREFHTSHKA